SASHLSTSAGELFLVHCLVPVTSCCALAACPAGRRPGDRRAAGAEGQPRVWVLGAGKKKIASVGAHGAAQGGPSPVCRDRGGLCIPPRGRAGRGRGGSGGRGRGRDRAAGGGKFHCSR